MSTSTSRSRLVARATASRPLRVGAASLASMALLGVSAAAAAPETAADGDVSVVNTETVQSYLSPSGAVESSRVYEQLSLTGEGSVTVENPVEESGLRNLDGFGGYDVSDGVLTTTVDVDGSERLRSVSDYDGDLPLTVDVVYLLDGEKVEPGDVVGAEGDLEVTYTVTNTTAAPREVTFTDGDGGTVTETAEVPIPIVGSLTTIVPPGFTDVRTATGNVAGDGKGGTKLSYTMTLFPPVGSDSVSMSYTATVQDGVVPSASITALPVNPLDSPTFKSAGDSYLSGSATGEQLVAGAAEIDGNLLLLRDGAGDLLAGLIQLREGADELEAGLTGTAVPGAQELAAGAGDLDAGLGDLDAGAGTLRDGAAKLDDGAGDLRAGAGRLADGSSSALAGGLKLADGLHQIDDGLTQLGDATAGLPAAGAGIDALQAGVAQILAGFGTRSAEGTLLNGLQKLESGLGELSAGSGDLEAGLRQLRGDGSPATPGLVGAKGGVDQVQAGLQDAVRPGGSLDQLVAGLNQVKGTDCGAVCQGALTQIIAQVNGNKAALSEGNAGLQQVSGGLGQALTALDAQLLPGAGRLGAGLDEALAGATLASGGAAELKAGARTVSAGLDELEAGVVSAISGVVRLSGGAGSAVAGSGDLVAGLGQLDSGSGDLLAGAGALDDGTGDLLAGSQELAAGTGTAADGGQRLAAGAGELASGLGDAADGSSLLAEGLGTAAGSAPELEVGAERLSTEGMSQLLEAGTATAQDYGRLYSVLAAGAERADSERMAYGAPDEAMGLTAYSLEIQGADGEGSRNWTRGLGALVVMGAGLGAVGLRRRLSL